MTLKTLSKAKQYRGMGMLRLKRDLLDYKRSGIIYMDKELCELEEDTPFDLYFAYTPSHKSKANAFPVPVERFEYPRDDSSRYHYFNTYFSEYYDDEGLSKEAFNDYDVNNVYIGEEYVWYYKIND